MRKLLIAALALTSAVALNAQDVYKQTGGEQNLEFQFAPLGGSPIGIAGIKYRKFTDANTAMRAEVFLGFGSTTDVMLAGDPDNTELNEVNSNFDISIAAGIEKHWTGTDRLSPYYGGVVSLGYGRTGNKTEFLAGTDVEENTTRDGSLTIGLNAIAGMDFYFADNIYLGAELGFGLAFTTLFDTVSETSVEGVDAVETPNGSSFNIGPNVLPRIRLGFLF
jgi:opacity protein-like surface antigen